MRYNTNGTLDDTFGKIGILIRNIGQESDFVSSVILQNDGKFIISGSTYNGVNYDLFLARFTNPALDNIEFTKNETCLVYPKPTENSFSIQKKTELLKK